MQKLAALSVLSHVIFFLLLPFLSLFFVLDCLFLALPFNIILYFLDFCLALSAIAFLLERIYLIIKYDPRLIQHKNIKVGKQLSK